MTPEQEQSERLAYLAGVRAGQAQIHYDTLTGWKARMEWTLAKHNGDHAAAWGDTYRWAADAAAEAKRTRGQAIREARKRWGV